MGFNDVFKENNDIYQKIIRTMGISSCEFWILYILSLEEEALTQRKICELLFEPKQTVNSALKKMKSDGLIELVALQDRRSKQVLLTEKGKEMAHQKVVWVIEIEKEAEERMGNKEMNSFLELFHKYNQILKELAKEDDYDHYN